MKPRINVLTVETTSLTIRRREVSAERDRVHGRSQRANQTGSGYCDGAAARAGARIVKQPAATFWGGYAGYFQDPDGHLWEVLWNPQLLPRD